MKKASKSSIKVILEKYAKGQTKLTTAQFKVLLHRLIEKKPVYCREQRKFITPESEFTKKLLAPLYADMKKTGEPPHRALVMLVVQELNKPFNPALMKKKKDREEEKPKNTQAQTKTLKSSYMDTKRKVSTTAALKEKLKDQWRQKTAEAWQNKSDPTRKIKSVGNGL